MNRSCRKQQKQHRRQQQIREEKEEKSKGGIVVRGANDVAVRFSKSLQSSTREMRSLDLLQEDEESQFHRTDCVESSEYARI